MPRPAQPPIGLVLAGTAKAASRAFDDALAAAGGSVPMWLILLSLKTRQVGNQRELADAVGVRGATLTHHLNAMEKAGLLTRQRDPDNRRIHVVELTEHGEGMFHQLRAAAAEFDQRLRVGLTGEEVTVLAGLLARLRDNVTDA